MIFLFFQFFSPIPTTRKMMKKTILGLFSFCSGKFMKKTPREKEKLLPVILNVLLFFICLLLSYKQGLGKWINRQMLAKETRSGIKFASYFPYPYFVNKEKSPFLLLLLFFFTFFSWWKVLSTFRVYTIYPKEDKVNNCVCFQIGKTNTFYLSLGKLKHCSLFYQITTTTIKQRRKIYFHHFFMLSILRFG